MNFFVSILVVVAVVLFPNGRCEEDQVDSDCKLPADGGLCKASMHMYHYNVTSGKCQTFIYGGCGGNKNRFWNLEYCQKFCPRFKKSHCLLPKVSGVCRIYIPSYYYDTKTGICKKFIYGGCGGNENRFDTVADCDRRCTKPQLCLLPKVSGPCEAYMPSYYHDAKSGICKQFIYGGCGGNANRFATLKDCNRRCTTPQDILG